jgi:UDP-GlcNAc:undecaprenyl-phosphate GlcNAc-1-phosphate transferase
MYACIYLAAASLALVVTPAVIRLARLIHAMDRPGIRTMHTRPIPRMGGAAIFFSATCPIVLLLFLSDAAGEDFRTMRLPLITMLFMAAFIFLIGLIDDLRGLPARAKLPAEIVAASVLCFAGVRIPALQLTDTLLWNLHWLSCPLTVLWIVGITNAVNLSDGLDGLAAGISAVACGVIAIFAMHCGNPIMAILMLALLGSLSGFLFYNFNPAKIFMGDCGSLFLGFTIAAASVICVTKSCALVGLALPIVALGIPIFDTFSAILRRLLERRSIFSPDRDHFHHKLIALGLNQRHAVLAIYSATCIATGLGLFMMVRRDAGSLVVFGCLLFLLLLLFHVVGAVHLSDTLHRLQEQYAVIQRQKREKRTFECLQLQFRHADSLPEWWQAVCEAAQRLDVAWVSLSTLSPDGTTDTSVWRRQNAPAKVSGIITLKLPLTDATGQGRLEFEMGILVDGSLESAGHRATLFSRLIDEHKAGRMETGGPCRGPAVSCHH